MSNDHVHPIFAPILNAISGETKPGIYVDGCAYCEREKAAGNTFFPRHFASDRCESGKHNHCTCDTCF